MDVDWIDEGGISSNGQTFAMKNLTNAFSVTDGLINDLDRKFEWSHYEVDPEWSKLCSFGPEDIGGPWEELGVIRRRRTPKFIIIAEEIAAKMNRRYERQILFHYDAGLFGLPIHSANQNMIVGLQSLVKNNP